MSDKTCLLCGEPWNYDDPMCHNCMNSHKWPPTRELVGGWNGDSLEPRDDGYGDYVLTDDVLWLVALWRLMEKIRESMKHLVIFDSTRSGKKTLAQAWYVLDKLKQLEEEAKDR